VRYVIRVVRYLTTQTMETEPLSPKRWHI
jgi:hypothetical protein